MSDYRNVWCPKCKEWVDAEVIDSTFKTRSYLCPNREGYRDHTFTRKKTEWQILNGAAYVVSIIITGGLGGHR